jgi:hypothetical protein
VGATVPQPAAEQDTAQVTPLLPGSLLTVAVNCAVDPAITVAPGGSTSRAIAGTVTVAEAIARELAADVAVTVTIRSLGGGPGAV